MVFPQIHTQIGWVNIPKQTNHLLNWFKLFSIVTFTTLGYGDIILSENWRILASMEAAAGIIFFGWSTAIVFMAIQNIYYDKINNYKTH